MSGSGPYVHSFDSAWTTEHRVSIVRRQSAAAIADADADADASTLRALGIDPR